MAQQSGVAALIIDADVMRENPRFYDAPDAVDFIELRGAGVMFDDVVRMRGVKAERGPAFAHADGINGLIAEMKRLRHAERLAQRRLREAPGAGEFLAELAGFPRQLRVIAQMLQAAAAAAAERRTERSRALRRCSEDFEQFADNVRLGHFNRLDLQRFARQPARDNHRQPAQRPDAAAVGI